MQLRPHRDLPYRDTVDLPPDRRLRRARSVAWCHLEPAPLAGSSTRSEFRTYPG